MDRNGNPADFAKLVTDAMLLDRKIGDPAVHRRRSQGGHHLAWSEG